MDIEQLQKENESLRLLLKINEETYQKIIDIQKERLDAYMELICQEKPRNYHTKSEDHLQIQKTREISKKRTRKVPATIYEYLKERGTPALIDELRQVLTQKKVVNWKDVNSGNRAIFMSVSRSKNLMLISDSDVIGQKKYGLKEWTSHLNEENESFEER